MTFDPLLAVDAFYLNRTHPLVAACCDTVLDKALGPESDEGFPAAASSSPAQ